MAMVICVVNGGARGALSDLPRVYHLVWLSGRMGNEW